jgi:mono/diheme cytochrome c family protein
MKWSALATGCLVGFASPLLAGDEPVRKRGEALTTRLCAGCHAVGHAGASPHAQAPPFRVLGRRYPIETLEEALGEGIVSGHPDMPEFKFSAADVGAVVAYLKSIQER